MTAVTFSAALARALGWGAPRELAGFPVLRSAVPFLGHLPLIYKGLRRVYLRAEAELGPFFWNDMGLGGVVLICCHPDGIVALKNRSTTSTHLQEVARVLLGDSMLVHDGRRHQHLRSAMNGVFTPKGLSAGDIAPVMADTIEARVRGWAARPELHIARGTLELALDVLFRMISAPANDLPAWRRHYEEYLLGGLTIPIDLPGFPRWWGQRARAWIDARLAELLRGARSDPAAGSLIAQLTRSRDEAGDLLSDHDLIENLRLLVLAGHHTSATAMAWLVIELAADPARWERLCDEALAAPGVPRSPKDLALFPFAEALFREVLRLHPPVPIASRLVTEPIEIAGRTIPVGAQLILNLDRFSRHESIHDAPERFLPERWLDRREPPSGIELSQFGGGPHFCLGYHVAWLGIVQFAVAFARTFAALGRRPVLTGSWPETIFLPIARVDSGTRIRFERHLSRAAT